MPLHLFTIICEFRGGTYCSQVRAIDAGEAVRQWSARIAAERPVPGASGYLAKAAIRDLPPVALEGLANAWCFTASVGRDLAICSLVLTAEPDR